MTRAAIAAAALLAGCTSFADPNIVVDLRPIAIEATVPEQVIDVDFTNPPPAAQLLAELVPSTVCGLFADPAQERGLHWALTMCAPTTDERCDDPTHPIAIVGGGTIADPDDSIPEPTMCATVQPNGDLLGVLLDALQSDSLDGFSDLYYQLQLRVGGLGADPADDVFASKELAVAARVPANRVANHNPYLDHIDAAPFNMDGTQGSAQPLPLGRCVDQASPLQVVPTQQVRFTPVEPPGVREMYVLPTLDGGSETFTESLTYQWLAGGGGFTSGSTGGPHDAFGNAAVLYTDWQAPGPDAITAPTLIPLWIVQRDERLGVQWYESCVEVVPGSP